MLGMVFNQETVFFKLKIIKKSIPFVVTLYFNIYLLSIYLFVYLFILWYWGLNSEPTP
jgi:hypothetical protein